MFVEEKGRGGKGREGKGRLKKKKERTKGCAVHQLKRCC